MESRYRYQVPSVPGRHQWALEAAFKRRREARTGLRLCPLLSYRHLRIRFRSKISEIPHPSMSKGSTSSMFTIHSFSIFFNLTHWPHQRPQAEAPRSASWPGIVTLPSNLVKYNGEHVVRVKGGTGTRYILVESVRNITRRSIPIPQPPVGGRPCSRLRGMLQMNEHTRRRRNTYASTKVSSIPCASSSPCSFCLTYDDRQSDPEGLQKGRDKTHLLFEPQSLFKGVV
jgi:hypothetical protein